MKYIATVVLLTLSFFELKSQTLDWALQLGGNYYDGGLDINLDNQGNVFVATVEWDTVLYYQNNNEASDYKCKIAKFDSAGNFIWEVFVPIFYQMSIDSSGNLYVLGLDLIGDFDYDPSNNFATITPLPGNPPSTYIVKFNSDGTFAWLRNFQAGYEEYLNRNLFIKCDNEGNILVSGPFDDILRIDFGPQPILLYTENDRPNFYIFKLDPLGNLLWQKNSDASDFVYLFSNNMEVDESGNIYLTGKFEKRLDFDLSPNNSFVMTSDFEVIIEIDTLFGEIYIDTIWNEPTNFIAKYNSNAELIWIKKTQHIVDLKVGSSGDIYCLGHMFNEHLLDFDPDTSTFIIPNLLADCYDIHFSKLDSNGKFIWAKGLKNNPGYTILRKLSLDENENLYFTGRGGRIDYDPSEAISVEGTNFQHFIAKYDSSGNYYWAKFYDSNSSENSGTKIITKNNFIYSVGQFNSPINLDPELSNLIFTPNDANTTNNDNNFDVFVQKIRQGPCDNYMLNITDIQPVTCQSGGSASVVFLHSNYPVAYSWDTSPLIEQSSAQFTNPGIYTINAISNECILESSVYINGPLYQNENDLQVHFSGGFFRPTFTTTITINASNNGCVPVNATIKFVVDSFCSFQSSIPAPDLIIGDTLIWNENSFTYSADAFEIEVNLETNLSANIGDSVNIKASISSASNEVDYTNNTQTGIYPVVNSYDPNNKEFSPQGKCDQHYILPNQKLTTTINFQNTGNAEAINVFILDTLSSFLDLQSLRILNASHSMQLEILDGRILKFQFSNIMLIDSATNEQMSKGFVTYEIDLLENVLAQSLIIHPAAQIYFDFNPPIYTNAGFHTLVNTIPVCVASIEDFKGYSSIFPNPTKDYFKIESTNNELIQIEIYSSTGMLVDKKENWLSKTNDIIQTSDYSPGIYLVKISSETKVDFHKLIIVK